MLNDSTAKEVKIPKQKLIALFGNGIKSAEAINLTYVTDAEPGIVRVAHKGSFTYKYNNRKVRDAATLRRIKSLVLPPAWERVWICARDNGHLQATGYDSKNRKQYKYHTLWNTIRNQTKFYHLSEFGKALPAMRKRLEHDLRKQGLPPEKVLAAIVSVMQQTCIRIGNGQYEKLYGSFGLTTMKDRHVTIEGSTVQFSFAGKKGIYHDIGLKSKRLANIVRQCRDIPGKELFQYYDKNGHRHAIDSGMLNEYIKTISQGSFTAKDFRTWEGTLHAIEAFRELGCEETATATKRAVNKVLDKVATKLGNTRAVCKKYYVHPSVVDVYTNGTIAKYLDKPSQKVSDELTCDERILLSILDGQEKITIAA